MYSFIGLKCTLTICVLNMPKRLDLVSEIEKYMENCSPVTITSLKDTLAYYFLYLRGEDPYSTGFHGLDEFSETQLAAMLQESLVAHYNDICFKNSINML